MPLNILRLNHRSAHPNDRIVFIKPLPGPDADVAEDFLKRIAAQCLPIMRNHYLSVTTLEEHEPNREFVGRNFNSGEVIQLVLKGRESGRWLPFSYVQMVMMHELAHCLQMNHSRAFWALRNTYANEMRGLWGKGYTGDGMWGRGRVLYDGQINGNTDLQGADVPEHLCGGTYRTRRGRKRKAKQDLSYQERKERRIRKKFGAGGEKLGEDEIARRGLEKGRWNSTKPRVAQSKRGRELRAAAILDRLERERSGREQNDVRDEETEDGDDSETDIEDEDDEVEAINHNGKHMIKVCADEDVTDDADALDELAELRNLPAEKATEELDGSLDEALPDDLSPGPKSSVPQRNTETPQMNSVNDSSSAKQSERRESDMSATPHADGNRSKPPGPLSTKSQPVHDGRAVAARPSPVLKLRPQQPPPAQNQQIQQQHRRLVCPACSLDNDSDDGPDGPPALLCAACACVLDLAALPRHWRCPAEACAGSAYVNASDAGRCGVCGGRRPQECD